jgi:hypothetical protein
MVTRGPSRRDTSSCSLTRVKELAADQAVTYASSRVENDITNLRYSLSDVCECLAALEPRDFSHSELHETAPAWLDVYKMSFQVDPNPVDDLYIKFKLDRDCIVIVLCSFHRERNL